MPGQDGALLAGEEDGDAETLSLHTETHTEPHKSMGLLLWAEPTSQGPHPWNLPNHPLWVRKLRFQGEVIFHGHLTRDEKQCLYLSHPRHCPPNLLAELEANGAHQAAPRCSSSNIPPPLPHTVRGEGPLVVPPPAGQSGLAQQSHRRAREPGVASEAGWTG